MFPLSTVLFPHALLPLHVFEPRYKELMADCLAGDASFGVVLIARGSEVGGGDTRTTVGTRAVITQSAELDDGRWILLVRGSERIAVKEWLPELSYPVAVVEEWGPTATAVAPSLLAQAEQCVRRTRGLLSESGHAAAMSPDVVLSADPEVASWQICAEAPLNAFDAQSVLSVPDSSERLALVIALTEALEIDLRRMLSGN